MQKQRQAQLVYTVSLGESFRQRNTRHQMLPATVLYNLERDYIQKEAKYSTRPKSINKQKKGDENCKKSISRPCLSTSLLRLIPSMNKPYFCSGCSSGS